MAAGGRRVGAGRPAGSKDRFPRRRPGEQKLCHGDTVLVPMADPSSIDPKRVLAEIAIDPRQPAMARVAAAKALINSESGPRPDGAGELDRISARAVALLQNGRLH
jgi:hypothetical protein